jgi:hypothetical protein
MPKMSMKDWVIFQRRLTERYWPAVLRGARSGGMRGIAILQRRTQEEGMVDRGGYIQRWKHSVSKQMVRFWNEAPYAIIIEEGRRPGARQPPTKSLIPWVQRKLGVGRTEAKGVAFVVARAIARRGLPAHRILSRATEELGRALREEITAELQAEMRRG